MSSVKQKIVYDIRKSQYVPGAIQFDSKKRLVFYACPCGCGMLGWFDYVKLSVKGPRQTLSCPERLGLTVVQDGKEIVHWSGWLKKGMWEQDDGDVVDKINASLEAENAAQI